MKPGQRVIVALRKMIASGELRDGERIAEIPTAERMGTSRMPVRTALRALEQEGLVVRLGARGYAARGLSAVQIDGAIEVRGVLEGLAARRIARQGLDPRAATAFGDCLARGDLLFAKEHFDDGDLELFYAYNLEFHGILIREAGNPAIAHALLRNNHLPFASAAALALDWQDRDAEFHRLRTAHEQHRAVVTAMRAGDADQAEAVMRSHARIALGSRTIFQRLGIGGMSGAPAPTALPPGRDRGGDLR